GRGRSRCRISGYKRGISSTLLTLAGIVTGAFMYFCRKPVLTDKDTILLADFVHTNGEADFDTPLKQGLALQVEQSPFISIFSSDRVRQTLRSMGRSSDDRVTPDVAREICQRRG